VEASAARRDEIVIKKMTAGSLIALATAVLVAPPTHAAKGNFGGVAYSPDDGVYGWVNHVNSKNDAIDGSVEQCEKKGGASCDWAAWNTDGCVALLADDSGKWAGGAGATPKAAVKDALKYAEEGGFTIDTQDPVVAFCTSDEGPDAG
jgi:hypothetical protein